MERDRGLGEREIGGWGERLGVRIERKSGGNRRGRDKEKERRMVIQRQNKALGMRVPCTPWYRLSQVVTPMNSYFIELIIILKCRCFFQKSFPMNRAVMFSYKKKKKNTANNST